MQGIPACPAVAFLALGCGCLAAQDPRPETVLADTGQVQCYSDRRPLDEPRTGEAFFGQDGQYEGLPPAYRDNGDGTVSDLQTGLMWSKAVDAAKVGLEEAEAQARALRLGGHSDWRVPTIKELYSLIDFRGFTGFSAQGFHGPAPADAIPFINTDCFDFRYGAVEAGERYIDAQWLSSTRYTGTTMGGAATLFGVNFADGRIKGYPVSGFKGKEKKFFVRFVRGPAYGVNRFRDAGDGTVVDEATGLVWAKADSARPLTWEQALRYAEGLELAGHSDWRLPNAKELQMLVDYTRAPDTTGSAAIDPLFQATKVVNEAGQKDYPFYWTSTTHLDGPEPANSAAYIAFGRAIGKMDGKVLDVHGAGAQRSDPKTGRAAIGHGPQGDARRVENFARAVRGGVAVLRTAPPAAADPAAYPLTVRADGRSYRPAPVNFAAQAPPPQKAGGGGPDRGAGFLQRLDKDGDGRVSRAEFDGPPDRFTVHDRDGDGFISAAEAPQGPPPGGGGGPPR